MQTESSSRATRTVAETVVTLFMGIVAFAASKIGLAVILFPELVALSHGVISRPEGKWASQPVRLILTPTATAIIGLFITRHLGYGVLNVSIIVMLSLIFIRLTSSNRAGDISGCPSVGCGREKLVLPPCHSGRCLSPGRGLDPLEPVWSLLRQPA